MRLKNTVTAVGALVLLAASSLWAQQGVLSLAQSAAKAKQIIAETIQALGGKAYLDAGDQTCTGQVASFGFHNQVLNYRSVEDYKLFPDKERSEYYQKRNIINVYNGKQGWTLDRAGVSDLPAADIADFQAGLDRDMNFLFRFRLHDPGLTFQYDGSDVVDLKQVYWVQVTNTHNLTTKIAVSQFSHLPVQALYINRDPVTDELSQETEYFSNYQDVQGIETPYQDSRFRNGQKIFQFFISSCQYNTGLKPDFFTKQSLEERWAKLGGKKKKKRHLF